MKDNWLKDIHDRMADFETEEPQRLWEDICAAEAKGAKVKIVKNSRYKAAYLLSGIAAAGLILFGIFHHVAFHDGDTPTEAFSARTMIAEKTVTKDCKSLTGESGRPSDGKTAEVDNINKVYTTLSEAMQGAVSELQQADTSHITTDVTTISAPTEGGSSPQKEEVKQQSRENLQPQTMTPTSHAYLAQTKPTSTKGSRFTMGVATSGGIGADDRQLFRGETMVLASVSEESEWIDSPLLGIMTMNRSADTERKVSHHSPIRTGLSFAYKLNDKWSIESGITYAFAATDIYEGSAINYAEEVQKLHYVGIPVGIRYKLCSWKKLDIYLAADVLSERCVYGQSTRKYVVSGNANGDEDASTICGHPFQWSVGAKAGAQYNLTPQMSVYAESGCSYYFDDHSSLETVFKERPLDLSLNLGLRFSVGK